MLERSNIAPKIRAALEQAGVGAGMWQMKLGRGVVGKLTSSLIALYVLLFGAVVPLAFTMPVMTIPIVVLAAAIWIWHQYQIMAFAERNPDLALMEGAELVQIKQIEAAAKNVGTLPPSPLVTDPSSTLTLPAPGRNP